MNIRSFVLALGAISILASSSKATGFSKTQHLIDKICHKTEDYRFCNRVFNDNLVPWRQHHDTHRLARISLEQGTLHAVFTSLNVSKSLSSSETKKKTVVYKKYLKDCLDGYELVKLAYRTAFGCFQKGLYKAVYDEMKVAWRAEEAMCEGYGRPHMLVHSNWEMRVLIAMTLATAHELARAESIQQSSRT